MCLWSGSGQAAARGRCTPGVTETARYANLTQNDSEPSAGPGLRVEEPSCSKQRPAPFPTQKQAETRHCPQARSHSDRPGTHGQAGARTRDPGPPGLPRCTAEDSG